MGRRLWLRRFEVVLMPQLRQSEHWALPWQVQRSVATRRRVAYETAPRELRTSQSTNHRAELSAQQQQGLSRRRAPIVRAPAIRMTRLVRVGEAPRPAPGVPRETSREVPRPCSTRHSAPA